METTSPETKKTSFLDEMQDIPEQIWERFKTYNWIKKLVLLYLCWTIINDLSKGIAEDFKRNKDNFFSNITSIPKLIWNNFWTADGGNKLFLLIGSWYVVKNLAPKTDKKPSEKKN